MEFASGGDLLGKVEKHTAKGTNFSEKELWSYLIQCLKALNLLHQIKICHRDLKCANLFLTDDGVIKLGDLNVSKVNKRGLMSTQTGTPYYASPEIWQDRPYDNKCDIWSLGCVFYELASLKPPFRAQSMKDLAARIVKGVYPSMPKCYSNEFHNVIKKMLVVTPNKRPSAQELLDTLEVQAKFTETIHRLHVGVSDSSNGLLGTIMLPRNLR
jgi:NIMA (never in mitosis gene a)-related kinase